jgi:hypothetical protein
MSSKPFAGTDVAGRLVRIPGPAAGLVRGTAAGCMGLLLLAAVVLGWRRLAGALVSPLEPPALLMAAVVIAAGAAAVRAAWRSRAGRSRAGRGDWFVAAILSAAVLAVGAALSLPGTSPVGLVVFWALLAAEEGCAWGPAGWRRLVARRPLARPAERTVRMDPAQSAVPHSVVLAPVLEGAPGDDVFQQLRRSRAPDGREVLAGWVRVPMAAGQRSANVHVAFCPPFARTPKLSVEQLAGPEARIKIVQLLPYGARFDLKLAGFSQEAATVLLQFSAETAPADH